MTEPRKRRSYSSSLRREHARATRLRIATAARELMVGKGYAETTMAQVARDAGVAVQTLYTSCPGGKPALAKLVYDITLAGDALAVPQSDRPGVRAIIEEPDPARKLARYAAMATSILRRVTPRAPRAARGGRRGPVRHRAARRAGGDRAGKADRKPRTGRASARSRRAAPGPRPRQGGRADLRAHLDGELREADRGVRVERGRVRGMARHRARGDPPRPPDPYGDSLTKPLPYLECIVFSAENRVTFPGGWRKAGRRSMSFVSGVRQSVHDHDFQ
ncbi:TetR/AcrR family transcriptional regulator [Nonomuraea ferruginea]